VDESLGGVAPEALSALLHAAGAHVIVLKPMAVGGFSACVRLADTARALGCDVVVTHLFDGPIALRAASVLAMLVHSPNLAAGLAPHAGLAIWPEVPSVTTTGSELGPEQFSGGVSPPHYWQALRG
jgi:L-alanine-DL-glutamate epimerase-like enolase superfamily enzyme